MVKQSVEREGGENRVNRILGFFAGRSGLKVEEVKSALGNQIDLLSMKPEQIISDQSLDLQKRFKYYQ
jgi:hypothetical protein